MRPFIMAFAASLVLTPALADFRVDLSRAELYRIGGNTIVADLSIGETVHFYPSQSLCIAGDELFLDSWQPANLRPVDTGDQWVLTRDVAFSATVEVRIGPAGSTLSEYAAEILGRPIEAGRSRPLVEFVGSELARLRECPTITDQPNRLLRIISINGATSATELIEATN